MSEDSMEAADLVPYLLVDERARGLLRNMARIWQSAGVVIFSTTAFSLRFLRRLMIKAELSPRVSSSVKDESALRLDEDATALDGVTSK
jgi:hypothetical protein